MYGMNREMIRWDLAESLLWELVNDHPSPTVYSLLGNLERRRNNRKDARTLFTCGLNCGLAKMASEGDALAQWGLGMAFRYGFGLERDDGVAIYWYTRSAARQNALGIHISMQYARE